MDSSSICFDLGLNHKLYATFIENEQSMNWKALREERMELTCSHADAIDPTSAPDVLV
jgi:hypothetical protein